MYSQTHHSTTSSIPLPPGMSPGAIIGKGGSRIKLLQSHSGARISVNNSTGRVEVSGAPTAVEEAVRLLLQQIDAFNQTAHDTAAMLALERASPNGCCSSTSGRTSRTIALPPGMSPDAVIGKGGSNVKLLHWRSGGAQLEVCRQRRQVEVSGFEAAVEAAVHLLQLQFDAAMSTGGAYPHPLQVHYLLDPRFGDTNRAVIGFQAAKAGDEVAEAADRREQLYVLRPSQHIDASLKNTSSKVLQPTGPAAGIGLPLSEVLAGLRLATNTADDAIPWVLLPSQRDLFIQGFINAAKQATRHRSTIDVLKLRFNLGKSFFFRGPNGSTNWTVEQLQHKSIPEDMKAVVSNAVTAQGQQRLVSWLLKQGFTAGGQKHSVSLHLVHRSTNTGYALSLTKQQGTLWLRKLGTTDTKLAFGTLLNGPAVPDCRLKLLAQSRIPKGSISEQLLTDLAARATLTTSSSTATATLTTSNSNSWRSSAIGSSKSSSCCCCNTSSSSCHTTSSSGSSSSRVHMPGLAAADMKVDREHHKEKAIYLGNWPSCNTTDSRTSVSTTGPIASSPGGGIRTSTTLIKVSVTQLYNAEKCRSSHEVACSSPQLQELLQQLLDNGCLSDEQQQKVVLHLTNIVSFAQAVARILAVWFLIVLKADFWHRLTCGGCSSLPIRVQLLLLLTQQCPGNSSIADAISNWIWFFVNSLLCAARPQRVVRHTSELFESTLFHWLFKDGSTAI